MIALALLIDGTAAPSGAAAGVGQGHTIDAATLADDDPPPSAPASVPLTVTVAPGLAWGYFSGDNIAPGSSPALLADVGYRTDEHTAIGVHLSLAHLSGTYMQDALAGGARLAYDYTPIFVGAFARGETMNGFLWAEIALGLHVDDYHDQFGTSWSAGLGVSLTGGLDVYQRGPDRVGMYLGVESELQGQSYETFMAGVAYRR